VDVRLWDERLSTVEAERRRTERRPRRRDMHQKIDDEVAALILQSYLDYQRLRAGR
jgi:putative transcription antitermination factor YqgF